MKLGVQGPEVSLSASHPLTLSFCPVHLISLIVGVFVLTNKMLQKFAWKALFQKVIFHKKRGWKRLKIVIHKYITNQGNRHT